MPKLKSFIESGKLQIFSKNLISELKVFVAQGNTYAARAGCTDDLVMGTVLFCRMAEYISTWDDASWSKINSSVMDGEFGEDYEQPMPVVFV